jgi:hypothetical protein
MSPATLLARDLHSSLRKAKFKGGKMSDEIKKDEQALGAGTELSNEPLPESELDKAVGGLFIGLPVFGLNTQTTDVPSAVGGGGGGKGWLARNIPIKPA